MPLRHPDPKDLREMAAVHVSYELTRMARWAVLTSSNAAVREALLESYLLRDDRLCGVIDFGCSAVGDPACDLTAAWTMFEGTSRQRLQSTVRADAGTWARARGWALWKALIDIPGRPPDDPGRTGARFGWRWDALGVVDQVIADFRSSY